uniref:Adrenal ferredoxin n=1 Tax=Leptobrachium leishanense TaxID=445787 RepID=A0A8C5M4Y9_9ANUR
MTSHAAKRILHAPPLAAQLQVKHRGCSGGPGSLPRQTWQRRAGSWRPLAASWLSPGWSQPQLTEPCGGARPAASAFTSCSEREQCIVVSNALRDHGSEDKVTVKFINRDGDTMVADGKVGESLLDVVVEKNLDIDGFGACEGTLACSTCHLIFDDDIFQKLDKITDEEMDMLDLAYGLTERSRLGCQICLKKWMDGMTVRVPEAVADVRQTVDMGKNS